MSFEQAPLRGVTAQYGARQVGGHQGQLNVGGFENEAEISFDGESLPVEVEIPAGSIITHVVDGFATGAVTAATVGAVDIAAADGAEVNYVAVPLGGALSISGPSAGSVVVKYRHTV